MNSLLGQSTPAPTAYFSSHFLVTQTYLCINSPLPSVIRASTLSETQLEHLLCQARDNYVALSKPDQAYY